MQSRGFGQSASPAFEEIGDVVSTEGFEGAGIVESARGGFGAVDFTEGDNFVDVVSRIEST